MTARHIPTVIDPPTERGALIVDAAGVVAAVDDVAASAFGARPDELRGVAAMQAFALHGRSAVDWLQRVTGAARLGRSPGPVDRLRVYATQRDGRVASSSFTAAAAGRGRAVETNISVETTGLPASTELSRLRAELAARRALGTPAVAATVVVDDDLVVSRVLTPVAQAGSQLWRSVGQPVLSAVHPQDRRRALDALTEVLAGPGHSVSLSLRIRHVAGQVDVLLRNETTDPYLHGVVCHVLHPGVATARDQPGLRDPLTGLASRAGLQHDIESVERLQDAAETAAVIVDIVGLDQLNQDLGYEAGDAVVRATAQRLAALVEPHRIARLGGGRFVIVGPYGGPPRRLKALARQVLRATALPVGFLTHQIPIEVIIGTATGAVDGLPGLLQRAGLSLNMFRLSATGEPLVFGPELTSETLRRARLVLGLRDLDYDNELHVDYQPIVDLASGQPVGYEALLRWTHPLLGPVGPEVFVPLAESMGTIAALGSWVLRRACADAAARPGLSVSVNVSARQLSWTGFADEVIGVLRASGLAADRLILEVTETAVLDESDASVTNLDTLAGLGVRISLDDFGTGFSSLSLLHRLPIRELKIDRSFVAGLGVLDHSTAIVATVIELARALGVSVVAEGIETESQRTQLLALGCRLGQGFLLGRPASMPQPPPV